MLALLMVCRTPIGCVRRTLSSPRVLSGFSGLSAISGLSPLDIHTAYTYFVCMNCVRRPSRRRDPHVRVTLTLPRSVLSLMDDRVALGSRSRFIALAAMVVLSRGPERQVYLQQVQALVERGVS